MRALFTTQPGHGHLNPFLPYAQALRDSGHEVRFASAAAFAPQIERHSFGCYPIGYDFTWDRAAQFFPEIAQAAVERRDMEFAVFEVGWKRWNPQAARDLLALFDDWRPDLLVREAAETGATLAGEVSGIPVACASWGALPADYQGWGLVVDTDRLIAAYAGTRREIGLPPTAERPAWERELVLSSLPPSWTNAERLGGDIHHVRLPALDPTGAPAPPPWLAQLGRERPLIYATLGTVYNGLRGLRRSLFEAFAGVPADVLFTVGANVDVQRLGDVPPNVRVEQFVPQSIVLAHADLLVSHAGLGTVLGAIYDGVPMVLITIGADHPINSSRAAELGIANTIDIAHADGRSLRDVINDALADDGLRSAARSIQQECNAMSPIVSAVETLERYAGSMPG